MQSNTLYDVRKFSVFATICFWFCWLIIPAILALIFQIILIIKTIQLDENDKNKTLYIILSIIGIFALGGILDIVTAIVSKNALEQQNTKLMQ